MTPTEFRLLAMFMREPGRTFTRDQIIDRVFGYDFDGFDRTIDVHISNLRKRISDGKEWEGPGAHSDGLRRGLQIRGWLGGFRVSSFG